VSQLSFTPPGGSNQPFGSRLNSGELQGLLHARNTDIPNIQSELSQLTSSASQSLNAASNAHSSVPAPATMTGQSLGIDVASAIQTFSGKTTLNIVNSAGVVQSSVAIDFSAGTMTPSGGAAVAFTPSTFISKLNTALGGAATVTANGTGDGLSITAGGGSNAGLVFYNDPTTPSTSGGKSFSQYFGLNNLVSSSVVTDYNTGLSSSSTSGYTSGAISFQLKAANGASVATVNFTPPSSGTVGGLVAALNNASTGLGAYGAFSLDANGALSFTPSAGSGLSLAVTSDTTSWNGTGLPMTRLFGLDPAFSQVRAQDFSVNSAIAASPSKLQTATFNASATTTAAILSGDTSGLDALARAGQTSMTFPAAGSIAQVTQSLSTYASTVSGQIGDVDATAEAKKTSAAALASEAAARLSASDGVNLDNELINLTTYQQAYSASARLVSAAQSMYQTLLGMVQ
jgi:flagellar hook-associated protein 1 FlgK